MKKSTISPPCPVQVTISDSGGDFFVIPVLFAFEGPDEVTLVSTAYLRPDLYGVRSMFELSDGNTESYEQVSDRDAEQDIAECLELIKQKGKTLEQEREDIRALLTPFTQTTR